MSKRLKITTSTIYLQHCSLFITTWTIIRVGKVTVDLILTVVAEETVSNQ